MLHSLEKEIQPEKNYVLPVLSAFFYLGETGVDQSTKVVGQSKNFTVDFTLSGFKSKTIAQSYVSVNMYNVS